MPRRHFLPVVFVAALQFPPFASDALASWAIDGGAVVTAGNSQSLPVLAPDGVGGVFLGWHVMRNQHRVEDRGPREFPPAVEQRFQRSVFGVDGSREDPGGPQGRDPGARQRTDKVGHVDILHFMCGTTVTHRGFMTF